MGRAQVWEAEPVFSSPHVPFHLCLTWWCLLSPTVSLSIPLCSEDSVSLWAGHWAQPGTPGTLGTAWQWQLCGGCAVVTPSPPASTQLLWSSWSNRSIPAELLWDRNSCKSHHLSTSLASPYCTLPDNAIALSSLEFCPCSPLDEPSSKTNKNVQGHKCVHFLWSTND